MNTNVENDIDRIKNIGDENPELAMLMLDSLEYSYEFSNEHTRKRIDLLYVRLKDKNEITTTSDVQIRKLLPYFEKHGTIADKQEVTYYAGSVYRDLQDTPRALQYFFQSLEYAKENPNDCDSIMLKNTYSNLNYLYYAVQDYFNAAIMAELELKISLQLNQDPVLGYTHVACANLALDSTTTAVIAMDSVLNYLLKPGGAKKYSSHIFYLLCYYSRLGMIQKADSCYSLICNDAFSNTPLSFCRYALSKYYEAKGELDSAVIQCKKSFDASENILDKYTATKNLYHLCDKNGNIAESRHYARLYMALSDSVDFGGRQEMASTVNNMYRYNVNLRREMQLEADSKRYKTMLILLSVSALFLLTVAYLLYIVRSNRQLKKIMQLNSELRSVSETENELKQEIQGREQEVLQAQSMLLSSTNELTNTKEKLDQVMHQMNQYSNELKLKEQQLSERIEQNKTFINLLHRSEMEDKAQDVIADIRQSASGKKSMTNTEWRRLYHAVDELYPEFKGELLNRLGKFSEQQMQVCYLIRIGLSNPQIQNITNLPRATVWRWVKKYEWILSL